VAFQFSIPVFHVPAFRGGPLEKWWGGGGGGAKAKIKIEQGNRKKIRAPEKFENKIRAETFQ
jgi:hypothetical protein